MKAPKCAILIAVCLMVSFSALACWTPISLEDFVKTKRLIVVGEIQRINYAPKSRYADDTAFIKVEKVLRSSVRTAPKVGSEIRLSMPSVNNQDHLSVDVRYGKGQRGIWILDLVEGKYCAGHPLSFHAATNEPAIIAAMNAKKPK
jgi:hypothetical protein